MTIYEGKVIADEVDVEHKRGFLFKASLVDSTVDMNDITMENLNTLSSLPIYFNCYDSCLNDCFNVVLNHLINNTSLLLDTVQKMNGIGFFIDSSHLDNQVEDPTIRVGSIKGLEKVLYSEVFGK